MPYNVRGNRLTVYDVMEAQGRFASNPANIGSMLEDGSPLYQGPVEYPKMLYHPKGEERIVEPERIEPSPVGPVRIPAKMELVSRIVKSAEEEEAARSEGWHDHPADAMEAAGKVPPPKSSDTRIRSLEAELARLQKLLPQASKGKTTQSPAAEA